MGKKAAVILLILFLCLDGDPSLAQSSSLGDSFLLIKRSSSAEIIIEGMRKILLLKDAILEYSGVELTVDNAKVDTEEELAELQGGVMLSSNEGILRCQRAILDGHSGEIIIPEEFTFSSKLRGIEAKGSSATLYYLKDTREPYKAVLLGNVEVTWEEKNKLSAGYFEYKFQENTFLAENNVSLEFAEELLGVPKDFALMPLIENTNVNFTSDNIYGTTDSASAYTTSENTKKSKVELFCNVLSGKLELGDGINALELNLTDVRVSHVFLELSAFKLTARLSIPHTNASAETRDLALDSLIMTGNGIKPVKGYFVDQKGGRMDFSADRVESAGLQGPVQLVGNADIIGENFHLTAERVTIEQITPELKVVIPKRFHAEFSEELIRNLAEGVKKRSSNNAD